MYIELALGGIILALFLTPLLTPSGKWFWLSTSALSAMLSYLWIDDLIAKSKSDYDYGNAAGAAMGDFMGLVVTCSFLAGLFLRFTIWVVRHFRGKSIA